MSQAPTPRSSCPTSRRGDRSPSSATTSTTARSAPHGPRVDALHTAGIAHGNLTTATLLRQDDGGIAFTDLGDGHVGTIAYWRDRDVAALLVGTAALVGDDRAIAAAVTAIGPDRVSAAIPLIQPAALPRGAGVGVAHFGKVLKELRTAVATATGVDDVAPLKVKRLSLVNIGMLIGIVLALAIAIPSLEAVDWHTVQQEFEHATWGWAVLTLMLWPLIPMAWATALMGCVAIDLPFVPTVLTQVACSFLNLITPNGIGGTALQLDYLHHQDVPVASGASAMVLSTGVGGAIQMALFLIAAAITATSVESSSSGVSISLGAIAVAAALVGVILWIPKVRSKVVPAVKRAADDIWSVLRNPKKGLQLFGGDLAGNLIYPALLGLCLLAFGQSLTFAQLVVVQVGAGMLGNVAPVPGGIGVQEAALTAGLTSVRHRCQHRVGHGHRVPHDHVRDPTGDRLLHAALAATARLRLTGRLRRARHRPAHPDAGGEEAHATERRACVHPPDVDRLTGGGQHVGGDGRDPEHDRADHVQPRDPAVATGRDHHPDRDEREHARREEQRRAVEVRRPDELLLLGRRETGHQRRERRQVELERPDPLHRRTPPVHAVRITGEQGRRGAGPRTCSVAALVNSNEPTKNVTPTTLGSTWS